MRFSLIGVIFLMTLMLASAVVVTKAFRQTTYECSPSVLLLVFRSENPSRLHEELNSEDAAVLRELRGRGATFLECRASSPWYPSATASLLTGLYPSEHGMTRAHAHLTEDVETLAERLAAAGFRTFAAVGRSSLLEHTNVLQGFTFIEREDEQETFSAFMEFKDLLPEYRRFFALVEIDVDALGGPRLLPKVLDVIYDGLGRDAFLKYGVLAVTALDTSRPMDPLDLRGHDPRIPFLLAGKPLNIGPGKCVLKTVSLCTLEKTLRELALGQGFDIRDAVRRGEAAAFEMMVDHDRLNAGEVRKPPPYFSRSFRFDDNDYCYLVPPVGKSRLIDPEGKPVERESAWAETFRRRHEEFLAGRASVEDRNIPQTAGPVLDEALASRLGRAWNRPELLGHPLHAVEHFRMAEALAACGYHAMAVGDLNYALIMEDDFPAALLALARSYASMDPKGARKYYEEILKRYGKSSRFEEMVKEARRFLGP